MMGRHRLLFTGLFFLLAGTISAQDLNLNSFLNVLQQGPGSPNVEVKVKKFKADPSKQVVEIDIRGNKSVKRGTILGVLTVREGDTLNPFKISRNIKNIQSLGFFSSVKSTVDTVENGKRLVFIVQENPTIGRVIFDGATVFDTETLYQHISSRPGDILNVNFIRKDIEAVRDLYRDNGYMEADIFGIKSPEKDQDPLVFKIGEGVVESIEVTGNNKTRDYVILREMDLKPGMVIKEDDLREDIRRIYNLNFFTDIKPYFFPGTKPKSKKLLLEIEERSSNAQLTFGGGYSGTSGLSFFSDLFWDNLAGTGQLILLKGQFGRATTYQFKYHNPWMWDDRKSFTFKTWLTDGELEAINPLNNNVGFRGERRKGVEFGVGWPFSYELKTNHHIKMESVELTSSNRTYKIHSYMFGISLDKRDVWFNPYEGHYHSLWVEKGFTFFADSLDFVKTDFDSRFYFPTVERQTIATRLVLGYITSPQLGDPDLLTGEIYRVGGSSTVRGYEDLTPFAQGNKMILASLEYRFLFNDLFQLVIFADTGYAAYSSIFELDKFRVGKGLGVRFQVPGLGPLRLDFGIDDLGTSRLHFNIGHAF